MTKVRLVQVQLANGSHAIGVVPAVFTDEELTAPGEVRVTFSDAYKVESGALVKTLIQRLTAAAVGWVH